MLSYVGLQRLDESLYFRVNELARRIDGVDIADMCVVLRQDANERAAVQVIHR